MSAPKLKIFFLSAIPPIPTWGGAMAYYRHCVERDDFDIFVVTDDPNIQKYQLPYPFLVIEPPRWLERLSRTRLSLWAHSYKHIVLGRTIPQSVLDAARSFKPDVILAAGGSWSWTALMAQKLAQKLKIPLVGSFMDWYDYNLLSHPATRFLIERIFRRFYQQCDLALCTSEGMREALGEHPNAAIFYPTGARVSDLNKEMAAPPLSDDVVTVGFAGNIGEWYGEMLERLITFSTSQTNRIKFRIYGSNPSWSRAFEDRLRMEGSYQGSVPFDVLRHEMSKVDILLLPMGFDDSCAQIERTSFKTKFLDYLAFQKPILIWGPDYCSAIRVARELDSAQCCTSPKETECYQEIRFLAEHPTRQAELLVNARRMYDGRFNPERIHSLFLYQLQQIAFK